MLEAVCNLAHFALSREGELLDLFSYLCSFLVLRISIDTVNLIACFFKDLISSVGDATAAGSSSISKLVQNGYRSCKKFIIVNFDYF